MGIGSVSDYTGLLQDYKVPVIQGIRLKEVQTQDFAAQDGTVPAAADTRKTPSAVVPERKDAALEDISITFNRQESFGYIGRDSDIHSLDVEKAIDDMKKDQVLQQYQYFVGSSRNLYAVESTDGAVIQKL